MAESRFLRFQDIDNDGLIDICDDEILEKPFPCKGPCSPNPLAIVPDWKNRGIFEPQLNLKFCLYQVTVVTRYTDTAPASVLESGSNAQIMGALQLRYEEFATAVVESLLDFEDKQDTPETRQYVLENLRFDKYYLDPHPNSRLKLLYSVPFDVMYDIPAATETEEEEEDLPGEVEVTYNASQMITKMIRVRKGLALYGRYLKVFRSVEGGNILFKEDDLLFNLGEYGDIAIFSSSILSVLMVQLEAFLNAKGFQIPGVSGGGWDGFLAGFSSERITDITFRFNNYKLKKMLVYTEECGEKPYHFGNRKLKPLNAQSSWKDKTAVAYLAQLYKMEASIAARVQIPWQEFVQMYTYPEIYTIYPAEGDKDIGSCIADALAGEMKELGEDILDEVFSMADMIAYKFNKNICAISFEEMEFTESELGLQPTGNTNMGNVYGMAMMQAFEELEKTDQVFVQMCAIILASTTNYGPALSQLDKLWRMGFEPLKKCGLFDLLMDAIKCLLGGLTLEEALASMIKAALKAMSIENFGDLFIGLPPDKQNELDALVKKKLESGEIFAAGSTPEEVSNLIAGQGVAKPWDNPDTINEERKQTKQGDYGEVPGGSQPGAGGKTRRTIGEQYDVAGQANKQLDNDVVMEAYMIALLEVYQDNLLAVLDEMNKFPGAQIVSSLIGMFDCPRPPLFNPSFFEFIKSLDNIFCGDIRDIKIPRLENPAAWIPKIKDITRWLWQAIKYAVKMLVLKILMLIFMKICELIGDAICKALEIAGSMAASLPDVLAGKTTFGKVIRDAICGPDATDQQVESTTLELMSSLGVGGAAFANRDRTLQFAEDIASSLTRQEISQAFLGEAPATMLEITDQLIEFEYPEFRDALPNRRSIGTFFKNCGSLFPLPYRQELRDLTKALPDNELLPANPSLCANEEQLENFNRLRKEMLEGRASPEQANQMFCDIREGFLEDLGDLTTIMAQGIPEFIASNMPPLVSEPGCDDGFLPYESEQQIAVTAAALGNDFEQLQIDYIKDMLGNGGLFAGDAGWGFMNMVLSDTEGNPLSAHHRYSFNRKTYVNFASNQPNGGEPSTGFFSFLQPSVGFSGQHGQFPYYVGEWMMRQFMNAGPSDADYGDHPIYGDLAKGGKDLYKSIDSTSPRSDSGFLSTNTGSPGDIVRIDFEELDFNPVMGTGVDLLRIPDFGYNTPIRADMNAEKIVVTREARKGTEGSSGAGGWAKDGADISLDFKDNAAGMREQCGRYMKGADADLPQMSSWSYGFDVQCYFSDIIEENGSYINRPDDNIRVKIVEKVNYGAEVESPLAANMAAEYEKDRAIDLPTWLESIPIVGWALELTINLMALPFSGLVRPKSGPGAGKVKKNILRQMEFEFLAVDNGLDAFHSRLPTKASDATEPDLDMADYSNFAQSMTYLIKEHPPQVALLADLAGISTTEAKTQYDAAMESFFITFAGEIGANTGGWKYGMDYDYLTKDDLLYVVPQGYDQAGQPYTNLRVKGEDGEMRAPKKSDMILGISLDQYRNELNETPENTRVLYLDPNKFGRNHLDPPMYVKPIKYDGWIGFMQVFFPDYTPCKPHSQNLINFDEIQQKITERYPSIPEDPRLKQDPDCAIEVPFNRILSRPSKAGMYGLIDATIRIYASVHLFKAMGVFSKVMPKFPDNFSNVYAAYIVEQMEEGMKDAQAPFWEWFTPFKDEMFWYGFLEQSVQYFKFLVDDEMSIIPTPALQEAMDIINDFQEEYGYPFRETYNYKYKDTATGEKESKKVQGLWDAKASGDAGFFQTLKNYRRDENLEAVQYLEEYAKLILVELVKVQLNKMGEALSDNMANQGFRPDIFDLDFWIFMNLCPSVGAAAPHEDPFAALQIYDYELVEKEITVPIPVGEAAGNTYYYTAGDEFRIAQDNDPDNGFDFGDEYVGYYHSWVDEYGDTVYYTGEEHAMEGEAGSSQDLLRRVAASVIVGTIQKGVARDDNSGDRIPAVDDDAEEWSYVPPEDEKPGNFDGKGTSGPTATNVFRPLGDIPEYGSASVSGDQIFKIEKYISLDGAKHTTSAGVRMIKSVPGASSTRISEVWPGSMREVKDEAGSTVGIEGEMGVRYGIAFYYRDTLITTVEVDSLDVYCAQAQPFNGSSKLLHCLLMMLKKDPLYKVMTSYIFSIKKVLAILAIYNDMGFLSSVGEVTVGPNDAYRFVPTKDTGSTTTAGVSWVNPFALDKADKTDWLNISATDGAKNKYKGVYHKPGMIGFLRYIRKTIEVTSPNWPDDTYQRELLSVDVGNSGTFGAEGWQHYRDRDPGPFGGMFVKEWDNWDRVLLRNSKSRIKKMFRAYYNSRDFKPGDNNSNAGAIFMKNLKARLMPSPGAGLLSWWQRRKIRPNPTNAKGELCDTND